MTIEEARKVADLIETADNRCSTCVSSLTKRAEETFPDFAWTYDGENDCVKVEAKSPNTEADTCLECCDGPATCGCTCHKAKTK